MANYIFLPPLSNCFRNAVRSAISFSFLIPAKTILVPGILALGSLMYSAKNHLVPGDVRILVGIGIAVAFDGSGMTSKKAVELRSDAILGGLAYLMTGAALVPRSFAGSDVLSGRNAVQTDEQESGGRYQSFIVTSALGR